MYLLDTCTFIWLLYDTKKIPDKTLNLIKDADNLFISIVTLWEMSIKESINKLKSNIVNNELLELIYRFGIRIISINYNDIVLVKNLPFHHKDPFDRMIIAQSINNDYIIITNDNCFKQYDVKVIW